ncbi:unnamed protein product [Polarella glacialis]|uniref:Uncharacterized protein n=1 Tax=Polarella glacialis TaxID=89957 RepID=A0A813JS12_POLGL|nr:unnamed protein product [Polarella glacialis]
MSKSLLWQRTAHSRLEDGVGKMDDFVQEQVVENPIAAHDDDIPLIGRYAMDCTSTFYHFHCDRICEVRVNATIYSCQLQGRLRMPVNPLHFRVENDLERVAALCLHTAKHQHLAVADGDGCNHRMALSVDHGTVVEHSEDYRCGAQVFCCLESLSQQWYGALVGVLLGQLLVGDQLAHAQALAMPKQLAWKQGRVDSILLDLRDTIRHSEYHG